MSFFEASGINNPITFFKKCKDRLANKEPENRRRMSRPAGILDDMLAEGDAGTEEPSLIERPNPTSPDLIATNASSNEISYANLQKPPSLKNSLQQAFRRKIARNTMNTMITFNDSSNATSTIDLLTMEDTPNSDGGFHSARTLVKQNLMSPVPESGEVSTNEERILSSEKINHKKRISVPVNRM